MRATDPVITTAKLETVRATTVTILTVMHDQEKFAAWITSVEKLLDPEMRA